MTTRMEHRPEKTPERTGGKDCHHYNTEGKYRDLAAETIDIRPEGTIGRH
jgi:hypothetical protein